MIHRMVLAVLAAIGSTTASAPTSYRLPGDVRPTHYILEKITDLDNFLFQGKVWIKFGCITATDKVYLHSSKLTIQEEEVIITQVDVEKGNSLIFKNLHISGIAHDVDNQFIIIKLKELLTPNNKYVLHIPFEGSLSVDLMGYYRSSYLDKSTNTTKWLSVTQFQATHARRAFPCFDEPAMKAKFTIKLAHKERFKSISNMPLVRSTPFKEKPGWVWSEFEETVLMSTYLVAYMVSEFEYMESKQLLNNVLFRVWARNDVIGQVKFACDIGPKMLGYFEQYFNVSYPLPKMDMIGIPDLYAGAMENWGIITYREGLLLYDELVTSQAAQMATANLITHELAHQWFGNLVTMKWWTDIWLNEGFATYVGGRGVHNEYPEWNTLSSMAVDNLLLVYKLDALESSHPVSLPIGNPKEILQLFDHISYNKGSFLLRMMNLFLGEEAFCNGVSNYIKKHRFGNAEQDDLWTSLTMEAHKLKTLPEDMTVKEIMDSWTLHTGYPVLSVKRDYTTGHATVSQKRYLAVKDSGRENKGCWWAPLTYSTPSHPYFNDTRPRHWLSCQNRELSVDSGAAAGDWLVFNNRFAGLYRVNYDQKNWLLLADTLNSKDYTKIDVLNRVHIVVDALDLAWGSHLDYSLAFQVLRYLRQETEYLPWRAAFDNLQKIDKMLKRTANYGHFQKFMRNHLEPIYSKLGRMTEIPKTLEGVKHQSLVITWSCNYGVGDCIKQAVSLFQQWKNSNSNTNNYIPKDLRSLVYCQGVRNGGEEAWQFMWNKYRTIDVGSEKSNILKALGCSKEVWILNRYLDWSIDESSGLRRQDSSFLFAHVAGSDIGYYLAKSFFAQNINRIHAFYSSKMGDYVTVLSAEMKYQQELEELKNLTSHHKQEFDHFQLAVRQSIESVVVNIAWMNDHYHTIANTLASLSSSFDSNLEKYIFMYSIKSYVTIYSENKIY